VIAADASRPTILVTGARGQVGCEVAAALAPTTRVIAVDRETLDLTDADAIARVVRATGPAFIVNAAAYTAVDRAESERELAFAVNGAAVGILAEEAKRARALLIHYSTDYVFDGRRSAPYGEDDATGPLNVYGESKLQGERAIAASGAKALVLRTSWVYGLRGSNFLLTIRRLAREREELRIVSDQTGVPNWSRALAETTAALIRRGAGYLAEHAGLYHLSATGATTWFEFARAIIGDAKTPRIVPIATSDYPTAARRPAYGVLASGRFARTFGITLPDWRDGLARCVASPAEPTRAATVG
jgi:dTDP-4-dehydrorhamnose reductase